MVDPGAPTQAAQQEPLDSKAPDHSRADTSIAKRQSADSTSFLGRDEELAELSSLLEDNRLITLTGPPGIGKSRLAEELARKVARRYPGGRQVVELAPVTRGVDVPRAVAAALSVHEVAGQDLVELLVARLSRRRSLLVLDNCEHVLEACGVLVSALLARCPKLCVLATSREPLALAEETLRQVPPLSVPKRSDADPPEALIDYPAVRLFVERAHAIEPGFSLHGHVAPAVVEICRRLDGIPLAIELAAARVEALTPHEIAGRLGNRFGLLTDGADGGLAHHQTLAAALDWSYNLLSTQERTLLGRLSVFTGGFYPTAATEVCGGGEVGDQGDVAECLERLLAKSLVVPSDDTGRHRLLETVRAYATERLEQSGEARALRVAHAGHYVALAEEAEPQLRGPHQAAWLGRLAAEHANLRAALDFSLGHGRGEWALRMAGSLVWFWRIRGHYSEGKALLEAALSAGEGSPPELVAKARWGTGYLAMMAGDLTSATPLLEESVERFRALGDRRKRARALLMLANAKQETDKEHVLEVAQESAALAREEGDKWCLGLALSVAGHEYVNRGELRAARPLLEECIAVARESGDSDCLRRGLLFLGQVNLSQGERGAAEQQLQAALALAEELGDDYSRGTALQYLGGLAQRRGDLPRARELLDAAMNLLRATRPRDLKIALSARATVAQIEGEDPLARELLEEALNVAARSGQDPTPALLGLGELAASQGNLPSARRLFEEALDLSRTRRHAPHTAAALGGLGRAASAEGDLKRATLAFSEALEFEHRSGERETVVASLESLAAISALRSRPLPAARLFAAADAVRNANGYRRSPPEAERHEGELASLRDALSPSEFDRAWKEGSNLTIEQAVAEAGKRPGRGGRPASGWESLTEAEQNVAGLVAEGLTNERVAERLFVAPETVKSHLSNIFGKLGISKRTELADEVWRHRRKGS